jgi:uncharacterized protein RhaS with RHS repeats
MYYNTFRYYDADAGSEDPINLSGGYNLYRYGTNPLSRTDPLGREEQAFFWMREEARLREQLRWE